MERGGGTNPVMPIKYPEVQKTGMVSLIQKILKGAHNLSLPYFVR